MKNIFRQEPNWGWRSLICWPEWDYREASWFVMARKLHEPAIHVFSRPLPSRLEQPRLDKTIWGKNNPKCGDYKKINYAASYIRGWLWQLSDQFGREKRKLLSSSTREVITLSRPDTSTTLLLFINFSCSSTKYCHYLTQVWY